MKMPRCVDLKSAISKRKYKNDDVISAKWEIKTKFMQRLLRLKLVQKDDAHNLNKRCHTTWAIPQISIKKLSNSKHQTVIWFA